MDSMRILIFAVFLFFSTANAEPKCHSVEFMSCLDYAKDYLNTLPKGSLPETPEEFDGFCGAVTDTLTCWDGFKSQCMTPIQKELESLVLEGVRGLKDDLCASGSSNRAKYLQNANCLNKVATSENTKKYINYLLSILETTLATQDGSISMFCCGFNKVYDGVKDDAIKTCGEEAAKFGEEMITSVISTLPGALCDGFKPSSDECQKVKIADDAKPTGIAKDSKLYNFLVDFIHNYIPE